MPKCPKCDKEVYFAERVTSLGKDWHRPCLKCEKCGKTLTSGGHAEVSGVRPRGLFSAGPQGLGRGLGRGQPSAGARRPQPRVHGGSRRGAAGSGRPLAALPGRPRGGAEVALSGGWGPAAPPSAARERPQAHAPLQCPPDGC
uniref:Cysteine-rich protein 1 n=1 Tax=Prolemur simus TaxID=1328070 RepID=A0A8C9A831_PROSS